MDRGEQELIATDLLDYLFDARKLVFSSPEFFDGRMIPYPKPSTSTGDDLI